MHNNFSVFLKDDVQSYQIIEHLNDISNHQLLQAINGVDEIVHEMVYFGVTISLDSNQSYLDDGEIAFSRYKHEVSFETFLGVYERIRTDIAANLALLFARTFCDRFGVNCMVVKNLQTIVNID